MKYDYVVFIGRFQPFHNGHLQVCKQALASGKHLIIYLGSMYMAPNIRHPIPFEERRKIVAQSLDEAGFNGRYTIAGLRDYFYSSGDSLWLSQVHYLTETISQGSTKVAIIGHKKDSTSYYVEVLRNTFGWDFIQADLSDLMDATDIRNSWLKDKNIRKELIPSASAYVLNNIHEEEYSRLQAEFKYVQEIQSRNKKAEELGVYPRIEQTADSIVTCAAHVLLGVRKGVVGHGQIAFPGGFVNNERLFDASIRELREETRLKVPEPVLRGSLKKSQTYDHQLRDVRGRVITRVHYFELQDVTRPKIKARDDFKEAFWKPIYWLKNNPHLIFADHWEIFEHLVGF